MAMEEGWEEEQRAVQNQIRQAAMRERGESGEEGGGLPRDKREGRTTTRQLGKSQKNQKIGSTTRTITKDDLLSMSQEDIILNVHSANGTTQLRVEESGNKTQNTKQPISTFYSKTNEMEKNS
uniref:Uncharacterized protein n=1 Tax=Triticum urartu TaxID=4572 RepID=A0A8R7US55_TRIUA